MRDSCHIRHLTKCPNWCRTWNICFHLIFSWKMLKPNFAFWDILMLLRCLNSKEIKLQSSIRVICIIFDLIFFSWKLKIKQIFQVRRLFQRFVKRRIWHELHIRANYWLLLLCIIFNSMPIIPSKKVKEKKIMLILYPTYYNCSWPTVANRVNSA